MIGHDIVITPLWAQYVIVAGAITAALGVLSNFAWRNIIKPIHKLVRIGEQQFPVLSEIASEFKNNGGSTLKDTIDDIKEDTATAKVTAQDAVAAAQRAARMAEESQRMLDHIIRQQQDLLKLSGDKRENTSPPQDLPVDRRAHDGS